jgi:4a-hydroxytetrahydrobiopterin dehydratase
MKYFKEDKNVLLATFEFQNFLKALDFVNIVWNIAEISHHHPDIHLHNYKYVTISTTTHDTWNNLTEKDYILAERIESSYKK